VVVDPADGAVDVPALRRRLRVAGAPVVTCDPHAPDVRAVVLADDAGTVFFHEGEGRVESTVHGVHLPADACWWDPFTDRRTPVDRTPDGGVRLVLERRRTLVLTPAAGAAVVPDALLPDAPRPERTEVTGWTGTLERAVCDLDAIQDSPTEGPVEAPVLGLGDWVERPVLRRFAGTYRYCADIGLPGGPAHLDLGFVGEAATVLVDGVEAGQVHAAPYVVDLGPLAAGTHRIEVLVSNSAANYYEGAGRPSGLIGPVTLTRRGGC
jgi:hypothetical protein